jgi:hypothetical protein
MATSVHIPKPLLDAVDRRARVLKISRNKLIVQALQRELTSGGDWPEGFFDRLQAVDPLVADTVDEMTKAIASKRRSKGAPKL